jgi:hypothetical protein
MPQAEQDSASWERLRKTGAFKRARVSALENYFFKLLKDDGAILAVHSAAHSELSAVWAQIATFARRPDMTGGRIIVTNQSGEIVILVGAATARSFPTLSQGAATPRRSAPLRQTSRGKGCLFAQGRERLAV